MSWSWRDDAKWCGIVAIDLGITIFFVVVVNRLNIITRISYRLNSFFSLAITNLELIANSKKKWQPLAMLFIDNDTILSTLTTFSVLLTLKSWWYQRVYARSSFLHYTNKKQCACVCVVTEVVNERQYLNLNYMIIPNANDINTKKAQIQQQQQQMLHERINW